MENSFERNNFEEEPVLIDLHDNEYVDSCDSPILNAMVRKAYFQHIKKILIHNASHTQSFVPESEINKYAQEIELNALKICMSSMVYRYVMLNEINNIKYMTCNKTPFVEKKLLDHQHISQSSAILNLYFKHYETHSENHDNILFHKNRKHSSNKSNELNLDQTSVVNGICDNKTNGNISPQFNLDQTTEIGGIYDNNIKTEPMSVEDSTSQCLGQESGLHTVNLELKEENVEATVSYVNEQEKCEDSVYDKVYQEMTQMFAPETKNSLNIPPSPTSIISSDRYFKHKDKIFWYLENEIKNAQYQQTTSTMYELNTQKYEMVIENIKKLFETEGSPAVENSPLALRKITYLCKERITWHVKKSLSLYYKKKQFRSVDEFRILAKNVVTLFLQIDPYMDYKHIYKAISKVFDRREKMYVQNISQIQSIVSKVSQYVMHMIKKSK